MINSIVDAISISLNSEFGDAYEIYTQKVEQGLQEPCFSIFCLNPTNTQFLGKRYLRKNMFCIQYFPESNEEETECNNVLERLFDCLEIINVQGDLFRGTKMNGEVVDGVLNFFINYDAFVHKTTTTTTETSAISELQRTETNVKG